MEKGKVRRFFAQAFEVFFIMVLCFATLLTSMLLNGAVIVGAGATGKIDYLSAITPLSVGTIIVILVVYLVYLLRTSNKELHKVISELYEDGEYADYCENPNTHVPAQLVEEEKA
ncbi:MAG: hypothetical protein FWF30_03470 [Coriobacteriia bacterium]|nr:hypothetical protein [Coriobacteriia bacterium]